MYTSAFLKWTVFGTFRASADTNEDPPDIERLVAVAKKCSVEILPPRLASHSSLTLRRRGVPLRIRAKFGEHSF